LPGNAPRWGRRIRPASRIAVVPFRKYLQPHRALPRGPRAGAKPNAPEGKAATPEAWSRKFCHTESTSVFMAPRAVSSGRGDSARPCAAAHCRSRAQRRRPCLVSTFRPVPPLLPRSERTRNPTPPEQPTNRGGWARAPRARRKYLRTTTDLVLWLGWTLGAPCHRASTHTVATKPAKSCQAESTYAGSEACGSTCGAACVAAILTHASAVPTWPSLPRARAKVLAPQAQRCATVGTARKASRRPTSKRTVATWRAKPVQVESTSSQGGAVGCQSGATCTMAALVKPSAVPKWP
jgi:hypothetical protein